MSKILVVDDSAVDRKLVGLMLDKVPDYSVIFAVDGKDAVEKIPSEMPDLVLTDLQMPHKNGLELVEYLRIEHPGLPVILMTAHGSDEIAAQALQRGAASYVPKRQLAAHLLETVANVLNAAGAKQAEQRLLNECWLQTESQFVLPNDINQIAPLVMHLQENLKRMRVCNDNDLVRVAVALREALSNAILHGNLEISSELREQDEKAYYDLIKERQQQEPYRNREVHIIAEESRQEAVYIIRDQGRGFDPHSLPDPTDPTNLERVSGRGLLLIQTFMDEVSFNEKGNEITMTKRRR